LAPPILPETPYPSFSLLPSVNPISEFEIEAHAADEDRGAPVLRSSIAELDTARVRARPYPPGL
jgi:hypothetical protein